MSQEKRKKIHLIYGCVTALLVLIVAALLIVNCVSIYRSGDRPFSREAVTTAFHNIAIPGWLCLIAVIGGIVLHFALPLEITKAKGIRSDKDLLNRYASKFAELPEEAQKKVNKEVNTRKTAKIITTVIIALLAVYPVIYYADVSHFGVTDINGDILAGVLVALIPAAIALVLVYITTLVCNASILRQIEVYKANSVKPDKVTHPQHNDNKIKILRCVLAGVAVAMIVLGIANDGVADVLGKAIRICTECIGLG